MQTPNQKQNENFPPITLCESDYERLFDLAGSQALGKPEVYEYLSRELDRAVVLDDGKLGADIVAMNSKVEFKDDKSNQIREVTLVYPIDADIAQNKISVMTPVGAALVGLATGQSITWYTPAGEAHSLTVLKVSR